MGRGRKGVLKQSNKAKATGGLRGRKGDPTGIFLSGSKPEDEKVFIQEDTLELLKGMNQQEIVYLLRGG